MHSPLPRWATRPACCWWQALRRQPYSISQLTEGSKLTRQAITKHLRVLESVGIVRGQRTGRESLFQFDPEPIEETKEFLALVSEQWDRTLSRLKAFVED